MFLLLFSLANEVEAAIRPATVSGVSWNEGWHLRDEGEKRSF